MNRNDRSLPSQSVCGCNRGTSVETPVRISNRPGLDAIAYRIGTHATFKETMLTRLSEERFRPLNQLKTRDDIDFTIALIDGWATIADVLTFYMERLANEFYLRTATELSSIIESARLIGYRLNPGVAAEAYLSFTLDDMEGSPTQATIQAGTKVQSTPGENETAQTFETLEDFVAFVEWNQIPVRSTEEQVIQRGLQEIYLKGDSIGLAEGDGLLFVGDERTDEDKTGERWDFRIVVSVDADHDARRTLVRWDKPLGTYTTTPASKNVRVFAMQTRASLFGHNAPDPKTLDYEDLKKVGLVKFQWNPDLGDVEYVWRSFKIQNELIDLDSEYKSAVVGSWIVLDAAEGTYPGEAEKELYRVAEVTSLSRTAYGISAKITRITPDVTENLRKFPLRNTRVFLQSKELELDQKPILEPLTGDTIILGKSVEGLQAGQTIVVQGNEAREEEEESDAEVIQEVVAISADPVEEDGLTKIKVAPGLSCSYERTSTKINANTVKASHGETVREYLGSGDTRIPYQSFKLSGKPLTYLSAPEGSGSKSTLTVYVDDIAWEEVDDLYDRSSEDQVYVTRIAEDGTVSVRFGNGISGARLPSGQNNVRAEYRVGLGLEGNVQTGQLNLLMTRPLGVGNVINHADAQGGDDPEPLDESRRNAPLTVKTLDRTVSLLDYEDYARAFVGIRKASAAWVWNGTKDVLVVTVAGPDGSKISTTSSTYESLSDALIQQGLPNAAFHLDTFDKIPFHLKAYLVLDPDFDQDPVLEEILECLEEKFSFDSREFSQPVWRSEVVSVIQSVDGVTAVDIELLYRDDQDSSLQNVLPAMPPRFEESSSGKSVFKSAEMVILASESSITLEVRS